MTCGLGRSGMFAPFVDSLDTASLRLAVVSLAKFIFYTIRDVNVCDVDHKARTLWSVDLMSTRTGHSSQEPTEDRTVTKHSEVAVRFGDKLRRLRKSREVSQEELAARAGLHRTYVSSVERGERNVSLETIDKLARALGLPMGELMP